MSSLKTLFLSPPSFDGFDGGAGSRYQAKREIRSFWYPTWLAQPAALVPGQPARRCAGPGPPSRGRGAHGGPIRARRPAHEYALVPLGPAGRPGAQGGQPAVAYRLRGRPRRRRSRGRAARVGGPSTSWPATSSTTRSRRWPRVGPLESEIDGLSFRTGGGIHHNRERAILEDMDRSAFRHRRVSPRPRHRGLLHRLSAPPLCLSVYRSRLPVPVHVLSLAPDGRWPPLPNALCGKRGRRDRRGEDVLAPGQGVSSSTTTPLPTTCRGPPTSLGAWASIGVTWSCNAKANVPYDSLRVMRENGLRLLLVGYETGSQQILNNIRKGTRVDVARRFTEDCHKLGITIHGTFIVGLPGETHETIRETIRFAREINPHTLQVSLAAPYPGTELHRQALQNGWLSTADFARRRQRGPGRGPLLSRSLAPRDLRGPRAVLQTLLLPPPKDARDDDRDGDQSRHAQTTPA